MMKIYLFFLILILLLYYLYNNSEHFQPTEAASELCNDCDACDYEDENSCCYQTNDQLLLIQKLPDNQLLSSQQEAQKIQLRKKTQSLKYKCVTIGNAKLISDCKFNNDNGKINIEKCNKKNSKIYIRDYSKIYDIDGQYDSNPDNNGILYLSGLKTDYIFEPPLPITKEQICSFSYFQNNKELPDMSTYFATDILGAGDDVGKNNDKKVMPFTWGYGTHLEIECDLDDPHCNTSEFHYNEYEHFRRKIVLKIIKKLIEEYNIEFNEKKDKFKSEKSLINKFITDKQCNSYNLETNIEINPEFGIEPNIFKDNDIVAKREEHDKYSSWAKKCEQINNIDNNEQFDIIFLGHKQNCKTHLINWSNEKNHNIDDASSSDLKQIYDKQNYKLDLIEDIKSNDKLEQCNDLYSNVKDSNGWDKNVVFYKKNNENWSISFFGEDISSDTRLRHLRGKYDYLYILLDLDREKLMNAFEASPSSNIIKLDDYMFLPHTNIKNLKQSDIQDNITENNFEWWKLFFESTNESLTLNMFSEGVPYFPDRMTDITYWDKNKFFDGFDKQREAIKNYLKRKNQVLETINYKILDNMINKYEENLMEAKERTNIGDYFNEESIVELVKTISGIIINNINDNEPEITLDELNEDEQTTITKDGLKNKFTKLIRGVHQDNTEQFVKNLIDKDYYRWKNNKQLYFSTNRSNDERIIELSDGSFSELSTSDSSEKKGKWGYKLANQPGKELYFNKEDITKCLKKCANKSNCDLVKYDKPSKSCLFYESQRKKYTNEQIYKVNDTTINTNVKLDNNILIDFKNINYIVFNKFYEYKNDNSIKCNEYLTSSSKSEEEKIKACNDSNCIYIPEITTHDNKKTDAKCVVSNRSNNEHYFHKKNKCHKADNTYIEGCTDINSCLHYSNINDIFNDSVVEHPTYSSTGTGAGTGGDAVETTGAGAGSGAGSGTAATTGAGTATIQCEQKNRDYFKQYCNYYKLMPTKNMSANSCGQDCANIGICYGNFSSNECSTPLETTAVQTTAAQTTAVQTTAAQTTAAQTTAAQTTKRLNLSSISNTISHCNSFTSS